VKSVRLLATLAIGLACTAALAAGTSHTVTIDGTRYMPEAVTVKRGDSVTWINKDPFPHTATSGKAFDSREIAGGKSWKRTFPKAGRYDYICTLHPNMKGTIVVE
jgi:plastocyanin